LLGKSASKLLSRPRLSLKSIAEAMAGAMTSFNGSLPNRCRADVAPDNIPGTDIALYPVKLASSFTAHHPD
jgi:hypothetical protein